MPETSNPNSRAAARTSTIKFSVSRRSPATTILSGSGVTIFLFITARLSAYPNGLLFPSRFFWSELWRRGFTANGNTGQRPNGLEGPVLEFADNGVPFVLLLLRDLA